MNAPSQRDNKLDSGVQFSETLLHLQKDESTIKASPSEPIENSDKNTEFDSTSVEKPPETPLCSANDIDNTPSSTSSHSSPLFSIGVIADIQYAPIPDGHSFGGVPRYYRHALDTARVAANHFQSAAVDVVINLGDIIDGKCNEEFEVGVGHEAIDDVITALSSYTHGDIVHTYGNHELYNLNREEIAAKLGIPFVAEEPGGELVGYYSFLIKGVRFVVLDSYDIAMMGRCPKTSQKRKEAERILARHNPNFPDNENSPVGLEDKMKRFVAFNGGVDVTQLAWLRDTLETSKQCGEKVIVLSHQPIMPGSSGDICLVWNYEDILQLLREFKCTVLASFSGHAHRGGYIRDEDSGIHFRVFEAVLESPDPHNTYGFVDIHEDYLEVRGVGECKSATYDFSHVRHD